ncbi:MAG: hypothetical protein H7326_03120 [Bdellovibrionaceae bacterium]|nr:hypothetical protein [Pseudobdellovibrionaceae bacterium]
MKLKNYFQIGIGAGVLIALSGTVMWYRGGYSNPAVASTDSALNGSDADEGSDVRFDEDLEAKVDARTPTMTDPKKRAEATDIAKASQFFVQALRQMTECVKVNTNSSVDSIEPTVDNIFSAVKPDLGDPILKSQDWIVWNMRVSGEERRLRIETDYSDNDKSARHLLYFKLDAQGNPTLIPLAEDSVRNPSEAFIASLQKDGEVYEEEKGERAYFDGGQEMVITQKNGHIDDIEFANGPKTFRCAGMLTTAPSCKCY